MIWPHTLIKKNLFQHYISYHIEKITYEPALFDIGDPKFVYVRQKFSDNYNGTIGVLKLSKPVYFK